MGEEKKVAALPSSSNFVEREKIHSRLRAINKKLAAADAKEVELDDKIATTKFSDELYKQKLHLEIALARAKGDDKKVSVEQQLRVVNLKLLNGERLGPKSKAIMKKAEVKAADMKGQVAVEKAKEKQSLSTYQNKLKTIIQAQKDQAMTLTNIKKQVSKAEEEHQNASLSVQRMV